LHQRFARYGFRRRAGCSRSGVSFEDSNYRAGTGAHRSGNTADHCHSISAEHNRAVSSCRPGGKTFRKFL
jgi:hypothetical protein